MYLPEYFEFVCPVKINSGSKALEHIPVELDSLNALKPIIISDKKNAESGHVDQVVNALRVSDIKEVGVFDGIPEAPDLKTIKMLSQKFLYKGFDSIIAVGSGKVMDVAKVLNIVVSGTPQDLAATAGEDQIKEPLKPWVAVMTGASTGFEASKYATLEHLSFSSSFLMPNLAIIDTRLVKAENEALIVESAMTAMTHAMEANMASDKNPVRDNYASAAIKQITSHLLPVLKKPRDKKGHLALVNAATMAACAFSNVRPGMIHNLSLALSDNSKLSAGIINHILLPYGLEINALKNPDQDADFLMVLTDFDDYAKCNASQRLKRAIERVRELQNEISSLTKSAIPRTLKEANIGKELFEGAARFAVEHGEDVNQEDCMKVLTAAFEGTPITSL